MSSNSVQYQGSTTERGGVARLCTTTERERAAQGWCPRTARTRPGGTLARSSGRGTDPPARHRWCRPSEGLPVPCPSTTVVHLVDETRQEQQLAPSDPRHGGRDDSSGPQSRLTPRRWVLGRAELENPRPHAPTQIGAQPRQQRGRFRSPPRPPCGSERPPEGPRSAPRGSVDSWSGNAPRGPQSASERRCGAFQCHRRSPASWSRPDELRRTQPPRRDPTRPAQPSPRRCARSPRAADPPPPGRARRASHLRTSAVDEAPERPTCSCSQCTATLEIGPAGALRSLGTAGPPRLGIEIPRQPPSAAGGRRLRRRLGPAVRGAGGAGPSAPAVPACCAGVRPAAGRWAFVVVAPRASRRRGRRGRGSSVLRAAAAHQSCTRSSAP